jgi:hypothetical protein
MKSLLFFLKIITYYIKIGGHRLEYTEENAMTEEDDQSVKSEHDTQPMTSDLTHHWLEDDTHVQYNSLIKESIIHIFLTIICIVVNFNIYCLAWSITVRLTFNIYCLAWSITVRLTHNVLFCIFHREISIFVIICAPCILTMSNFEFDFCINE